MYIFWATLGLLFLYLDFKKTSKIKLCFASSFLFSAIISYKFPENNLYQFLSPVVFFGIFYFLIGATFKNEQRNILKEKELDSNFIGKTAIVKKDIGRTLSIDGLGHIEFNNQLWNAKSIDDKIIKAGSEVEIVSKENLIMNVKVK